MALEGLVYINKKSVEDLLLASSFGSTYTDLIETRATDIEAMLTYENVKKGRPITRKFFISPFKAAGKFEVLLFRPHFIDLGAVVKIDIVQLWEDGGCREIGYRFENEERRANSLHNYPHMQVTKGFNHNVLLGNMNVPENMPDVPIAEKRPHSRLFAALVAFVGLDTQGTIGLASELGKLANTGGSTAEIKAYLKEVKATCRDLSRAWNGKCGFHGGSRVGRVVDGMLARWC